MLREDSCMSPGVSGSFLLRNGCLVAGGLCHRLFAPSLFSQHFPIFVSWIFPISLECPYFSLKSGPCYGIQTFTDHLTPLKIYVVHVFTPFIDYCHFPC